MNRHRLPLLGIGYLLIVSMLIGLSVGTYTKSLPWQVSTRVTLVTTAPGLELNPLSDVKLQGKRVGEVRSISSDGREATIVMALDSDSLELIPANVDAAIIPKTLFGEKFVDLRPPKSPATERIGADDRIRMSTTSVEIGRVFSRLVPILRTLRPDQLSITLTSLESALSGQGKRLGNTLNQLDDLLGELDPEIPTLIDDLRALDATSDIYTESAPDLFQLLASTAGISRELLVPKENRFSEFLDKVASTTDKANQVLEENAEALVTISGRSRPVLALLNEYSTSIPCLLNALERADVLANQTVGARGPFTNLTLEVIADQDPYRFPQDHVSSPTSDSNLNNLPVGVPNFEPYCAKFRKEVYQLKDPAPYSQTLPGAITSPRSDFNPTKQSAESPDHAVASARRALARAIAGQKLGVDEQQLPPYAELLIDPLLSNGELTLK